jgi:hypothetical protein
MAMVVELYGLIVLNSLPVAVVVELIAVPIPRAGNENDPN